MLPALETVAIRRRRLGLTQTQLADLAGVSQSYIAKLEAKKIEPSYTKVKAIFEALQRLERKREARASEIMTSDVVGVKASDVVQKAVELMSSFGYSQLPVFEGDRPVGCISEKIIINGIVGDRDGTPFIEMPIYEIMEEVFPQVGEDAPISLLRDLLKIYPAVLVYRRGKNIGIVTKADLLKTLR